MGKHGQGQVGGVGSGLSLAEVYTEHNQSSPGDRAFLVGVGAQLERQALWTLHWNMGLPITATVYSSSLQGGPQNLIGWLLLPISNKETEAQRD